MYPSSNGIKTRITARNRQNSVGNPFSVSIGVKMMKKRNINTPGSKCSMTDFNNECCSMSLSLSDKLLSTIVLTSKFYMAGLSNHNEASERIIFYLFF